MSRAAPHLLWALSYDQDSNAADCWKSSGQSITMPAIAYQLWGTQALWLDDVALGDVALGDQGLGCP